MSNILLRKYVEGVSKDVSITVFWRQVEVLVPS